jgi:transcriptional regulator with XRE-family HTH domain
MGAKIEHRKRGRPPGAMNAFARWIRDSDQTRDEVARRLRKSRAYIDRLCTGARRPDLETAIRIEDLTEGVISVRFWLRTPKHSGD